MAEGALFIIAEGILKILGSIALDEIAAAWGFKSQLDKLTDTIGTVKSMLLDAQHGKIESHAVQHWLQRLQGAVYDADDFFDEFATMASMNEAMKGNKLTKRVRSFFSCSNPIALACNISKKIKCIKETLDVIVQDGQQIGLTQRCWDEIDLGQVQRPETDKTHSFAEADQVIGQEEEKKDLLKMLLSCSNTGECMSVLVIVGMGGLGKTTLAQHLYDDELVERHFDLRLWVCVSEHFDDKEIIKKILMSYTNAETPNLGQDQLQSQLRQAIGGKKYLLVLDDTWNEDREKWLKMSSLLKVGKEGSIILVTTRSTRVAEIMGTVPPYHLGGLLDENSQALFQKVAFKPGQEHTNPRPVEMGKEIVQRCGNVPLAIRTLGSLLYGQSETKWLSVKYSKNVAEVSRNDIMTF